MDTKIRKEILGVAFAFVIVSFLFFAVPAQGAVANLTCEGNAYPWCTEGETQGIAGLVARFYTIALSVSGVIAFGILVYGAILWSVSGIVSKKQEAREWIQGALWGILLLATGYLILQTINPNLVELKNPQLDRCIHTSQATCEAQSFCRWNVPSGGRANCVNR